MDKIRIGKDILIKWRVSIKGSDIDLKDRNLTLIITSPTLQKREIPFSTDFDIVTGLFEGIYQKVLGIYVVTLWENYGTHGQTCIDKCNAFMLVPYTCMENEENGLGQIEVDLGKGDLQSFTGAIQEAPKDGETYGRCNGQWSAIKDTGGNLISVDSELSETSTNPVQNKVIAKKLNNIDRVFDGGTASSKYGGARVIDCGKA